MKNWVQPPVPNGMSTPEALLLVCLVLLTIGVTLLVFHIVVSLRYQTRSAQDRRVLLTALTAHVEWEEAKYEEEKALFATALQKPPEKTKPEKKTP